jgi:hypothetical protein
MDVFDNLPPTKVPTPVPKFVTFLPVVTTPLYSS